MMKNKNILLAVVLIIISNNLAGTGVVVGEESKKHAINVVGSSENKIFDAVMLGNLPKVKDLLNEGVSVNTTDEFGHTLLYWAAGYGYLNIVKELLKRGAIDYTDAALGIANNPEIRQLLLKAKEKREEKQS